jgi:hypothetical protein
MEEAFMNSKEFRKQVEKAWRGELVPNVDPWLKVLQQFVEVVNKEESTLSEGIRFAVTQERFYKLHVGTTYGRHVFSLEIYYYGARLWSRNYATYCSSIEQLQLFLVSLAARPFMAV